MTKPKVISVPREAKGKAKRIKPFASSAILADTPLSFLLPSRCGAERAEWQRDGCLWTAQSPMGCATKVWPLQKQ